MQHRTAIRRARSHLIRALSTAGGGLILYHEVWVSSSAEPLLVLVGLWLAGAPIADLLDKLRTLTVEPPKPPNPPSPPEVPPSMQPPSR
jgi:hypothetical protein